MLKLCCAITGDDYSLVRQDTPKSKKKIITLGFAVFIPVMLWFANAYLLMNHVLNESVAISLLTALFCAVFIFLIERNIVMSNGKLTAITRIILGLVIALLGSIGFDEVIFRKDIDQQMEMNKTEIIQDRQNSVKMNFDYELNLLAQEVNEKHILWIKALEIAQKESDGTDGSGQKGVHEITKLKLQIAKQKELDYLAASAKLEELKGKVSLDILKAETDIQDSFKNDALLCRIKAMFELISKNGWMKVAYILFTVLIFMTEFIVVITKYSWPVTNYERKVELIESIGERRMQQFITEDKKVFQPVKTFPMYKNAEKRLKKLSNSSAIF